MTATASEPTVTRSIEISAPPADVYGLITDLDVLAELADEAYAMAWVGGSGAAPGHVFTGRNRNGRRRWTTRCTVTAADPDRTFEFEVATPFPPVPVARWRYDVEPTADGSRVTESTWDLRPGWFRKPAELVTGVHDRAGDNGRNIEATLRRLRARAERG